MKKKLLFIGHSSLEDGGAEKGFQNLLALFSQNKINYEIDSIFPYGKKEKIFSEYCNRSKTYEGGFLPVSYRSILEYYGFLKTYFKQKKLVNEFVRDVKYDLIIINVSVLFWFVKILKNKGFKILVIVREEIKPNILRKIILKYYSKKVDYLIFVNNYCRKEYEKLSGKKNAVTIYDCPENFHEDYKISDLKVDLDKHIINILKKENIVKFIVSGTIYELKNQIMILKSMNILKKRNHKLPYVFITGKCEGDGNYYFQILDYIKKNNLSDNVFILKNLKKNEYLYIFYNIDGIVITSTNEGGPTVFFEAMILNKLVISTFVGAPRDLIINGENGYLVKNEFDLAEKMSELIRNQNIHVLSNNLSKLYNEKFRFYSPNEKYKSIIDNLINE